MHRGLEWLSLYLSFLAANVARDNVAFDLDGMLLERRAIRFDPCTVAVQAEDHSWWLSPK